MRCARLGYASTAGKERSVGMSILKRIISAALLLSMVVGVAIGYAAVVDNLGIGGNASAEASEPVGVYIKEIELVKTSNAAAVSAQYALPTTVALSAKPQASGGSLTYRIKVYNNSDVTYWYIGEDYETKIENNSLIGSSNGITVTTKEKLTDSSRTFNEDDWIPARTERDFYVTYTFGKNAQSYPSTIISFSFGIRMDAVHDEFLAVLNNMRGEDSYAYISGVFNEQYAKDGSVTIDSKNEPEVFAALFPDLKVNLDGAEKTATVTIRRENVDGRTTGDSYAGGGPSGCEYTLYITVDTTSPATVYAIAYTHGSASAGGLWSQLGELYEGTASLNADGTVNYSTWIAKPMTYTVASVNGQTMTYKVGQANGDQYDIKKTFEDIISVADQNFYNFIDNLNIFKTIYDILKKHSGSTDPAVENLRVAFENASPYYENRNNGQEFKAVRKYTRAEVIPGIENLQRALDYYYSAYGS